MTKKKSVKHPVSPALEQAYDESADRLGQTLLYQFPSALKWIGKGRASKKLYAWSRKILRRDTFDADALATWINEWIVRDAQCPLEERQIHDAVLLAQLTPFLTQYMDILRWGQLVTHLLDYESLGCELHPKESPLKFAIAGTELPIVLQCYHRALSESTSLNRAAKNMIVSLEESLGDDALPHANMLDGFQEVLASWTRFYFSYQECSDITSSREDIEESFQRCARNSLLLSRVDNEVMCTDAGSIPGWKRLRELAVTLAGEPAEKRLLCIRQPKSASRVRSYSKYALPEMSFQSDWSEIAVARSCWEVGSSAVYITYANSMRVEVEGANGLIVSRVGEPRLSLGDERGVVQLDRKSDWTCTSWFNDHEAVYMEFETRYDCDVTVQRQVVIAKDESVILFADAAISEADSELQYSCEYELTERLQLFESEEHSEGFVVGREPEALVLPLGLNEWRELDCEGAMRKTSNGFEYTINGQKGTIYAPLLFCLTRDAGTEPYTWRKLSVAEGLSRSSDNVAVGYRVQLNESQWLIYRSLSPAASRSVLGQNTTAEFIFGAMDDKGEFHQYVGVEGVVAD
ncbi:MAG: hypothetical protein ACJZ8O_09665 [Pirellulaceae bacterium]